MINFNEFHKYLKEQGYESFNDYVNDVILKDFRRKK